MQVPVVFEVGNRHLELRQFAFLAGDENIDVVGADVLVQDFAVEAPKTKDLLNKLNGMGLNDVLIVSDAVDQNLYLAARNLPHVDVRDVQGSDPVSLIAYEKVLITVSAVKKFEELLG